MALFQDESGFTVSSIKFEILLPATEVFLQAS
jgi:hypothetical protein